MHPFSQWLQGKRQRRPPVRAPASPPPPCAPPSLTSPSSMSVGLGVNSSVHPSSFSCSYRCEGVGGVGAGLRWARASPWHATPFHSQTQVAPVACGPMPYPDPLTSLTPLGLLYPGNLAHNQYALMFSTPLTLVSASQHVSSLPRRGGGGGGAALCILSHAGPSLTAPAAGARTPLQPPASRAR